MYNEIDGDFDDMAISTFKVGLPVEHDLRKSLTGKPITSVVQLIDRIDKYKRVEEDQQQGKGKAKIGGYDVKRVLVDQGNAVEIMYPDLYKGLNLKPKDLTAYDSPLVSFKGKTVVPRGQIRLPIQTVSEVVEMNFIVVDAYSPYTAIMAKPQLHALGAISSTLHQKVKYPSESQVEKVVRSQSMARQCMVAAISHRLEAESSASAEKSL
ncbi:uncharacterized protein LOC126695808 [Quercus robur]|uniref:uncharacterized protein LOC126695808 n=1 Tax=Quercus robur TaxID=38942 RepID=UPI0021610F4B|nr:uncharacterized protein LOC126695808 [Quercus robur]